MKLSLIDRARETVCAVDIANVASFRRIAALVHGGSRLSKEDWRIIGESYQPFSTKFPELLRGLISRLTNAERYADAREWLEQILDEEDGKNERDRVPHAKMFSDFLLATGAGDIGDVSSEASRALFEQLTRLYLIDTLEAALGAQTAFEFIGEELIRNFSSIAFLGTEPSLDRAYLRYFDVHLVAEAGHVDRMVRVANTIKGQAEREQYLYGALEAS